MSFSYFSFNSEKPTIINAIDISNTNQAKPPMRVIYTDFHNNWLKLGQILKNVNQINTTININPTNICINAFTPILKSSSYIV